jgi:hypothetical protein
MGEEMRNPEVPENLAGYRTTLEITGRIVAYREGEIPFAQLVDELSHHDYKDPTRYGETHTVDSLEGADYSEPGTVGELYQARSIGLLSDVELETILSATLRAHGA